MKLGEPKFYISLQKHAQR